MLAARRWTGYRRGRMRPRRLAARLCTHVLAVLLQTSCTTDWADGTWQVDASTLDAVRERAATWRRHDQSVGLAERFRLEIHVPTARVSFADGGGAEIDPFDYLVGATGRRELELTAVAATGSLPGRFTVMCSSDAPGPCTSLDLSSPEAFVAVDAPVIVLSRVQ